MLLKEKHEESKVLMEERKIQFKCQVMKRHEQIESRRQKKLVRSDLNLPPLDTGYR